MLKNYQKIKRHTHQQQQKVICKMRGMWGLQYIWLLLKPNVHESAHSKLGLLF